MIKLYSFTTHNSFHNIVILGMLGSPLKWPILCRVGLNS